MSLLECLEEMLSHLNSLKYPVGRYLQDGLDTKKISEVLRANGIAESEEIVELYSWKNGIDLQGGEPLDDIQFIPGFHILSIENAIEIYLALCEIDEWSNVWFPFMANDGGDFYAVDLTNGNSSSTPIVAFVTGYPDQEHEYESMNCMMATFLKCFKANITFIAEDGYLDMDDDAHAEIARELNPSIECWQD